VQRAARARGELHHTLAGKDFGDAEVEHLDGRASRDRRQKQVGGFDVSVRYVLPVRRPERQRGRLEQSHGRGEPPPACAAGGTLLEVVGEREAVEPLEHEVGRPHAMRRSGRTEIERLHDARARTRQSVEQPPLDEKASVKLVAVGAHEAGR
jgi:hypothetical protein